MGLIFCVHIWQKTKEGNILKVLTHCIYSTWYTLLYFFQVKVRSACKLQLDLVEFVLNLLLEYWQFTWIINSFLSVLLEMWRGDYATYSAGFMTEIAGWTWLSWETLLLLHRGLLVRLSLWLAQGDAALWLQQIALHMSVAGIPPWRSSWACEKGK